MLAKLKRPGGLRGTLLLASTAALIGLSLLHQRRSPPASSAPPDPAPDPPRPEQAEASFGFPSHLSKHVIFASLFAVLVVALATAVPAVAALAQGQSLLQLEPAFSGIASTGVRPRPLAQIEFLRLAAAQAAEEPASQGQPAADKAAPQPTAQPAAQPTPQPTPQPASQPAPQPAPQPTPQPTPQPAPPPAPQPELAAAIESAPPAPVGGSVIRGARLTFYNCVGGGFCGNMSSGQRVHEGAAACSYDLPLGTRFTIASDPSGRVYQCLDRGMLSPTWVDVWFHDAASGWAWQAVVGNWSDIILIEG